MATTKATAKRKPTAKASASKRGTMKSTARRGAKTTKSKR